jgi:hypothetical protein
MFWLGTEIVCGSVAQTILAPCVILALLRVAAPRAALRPRARGARGAATRARFVFLK